MIIARLKLTNWRNFTEIDVPLRSRCFHHWAQCVGQVQLTRRRSLSARRSHA